MSAKVTSGRRTAGKSQLLEQSVEALQIADFHIYASHPEWRNATDRPSRYVVRGWQETGLYGTPGRKEALIVDGRALPDGPFVRDADGVARIIVEAKWQETSGSTDEKLPFVWHSFLASPVPNFVVILDGAVWQTTPRGKAGAAWLKGIAESSTPPGKRLTVVIGTREFGDLARRAWSLGALVESKRRHEEAATWFARQIPA